MLELFVIYERPKDFPRSYVLRRHVVRRVLGSIIGVPDDVPRHVAPSLDDVREQLPAGLKRIQKPGDDPDPCVHEVWI